MAEPFRLLRLREVIQRTGLSRSTIYRLASDGRFPTHVKLSDSASAWREDELAAWIDSRPRATGAKVAA